MPDETTYYWMYNEGMTKFVRFAVDIDERVDIREYKIQSHHTLEEAGCPIEPDWSTDVDCFMKYSHAQEHWMELVRGGWRIVDDKIGRIEQETGMGTCWVTLNNTRKVKS
jgi:hypothetical protein